MISLKKALQAGIKVLVNALHLSCEIIPVEILILSLVLSLSLVELSGVYTARKRVHPAESLCNI